MLKLQVSFPYDLSLEVDRDFNDLIDKFARNNKVFMSKQLSTLINEFKTREFVQNYDAISHRVLKTLYLLSENPIIEGQFSRNSILQKIAERKEINFRGNNSGQILNKEMKSENGEKSSDVSVNYSSDESVNEKNGTSSTKKKKDLLILAPFEADKIVIGNKRLKIKPEQNETRDAKIHTSDIFKSNEGSVREIIKKPLGFSDILMSSELFENSFKNTSKKSITEPQLIYDLLSLIQGQESSIFEVLKTGLFVFEIIQKRQIFLENMPTFDCKKIIRVFLDFVILVRVLKTHLQQATIYETPVLQKLNFLTQSFLDKFTKKICHFQKILVYQIMVSGNETDFFHKNEKLGDFRKESITIMTLNPILELEKPFLSFLVQIFTKLVGVRSSEIEKSVQVIDVLNSAFEMRSCFDFKFEKRNNIVFIFGELVNTISKKIFKRFLINQDSDFKFVSYFCKLNSINEGVLLVNFFENKCLFAENKFPYFFKKNIDNFYKIYCSFLIYRKLFEKFCFNKDVYILPILENFQLNKIKEYLFPEKLKKKNLFEINFLNYQKTLENNKLSNFSDLFLTKSSNAESLSESNKQNKILSLEIQQLFLSSIAPSKINNTLVSTFAKKSLIQIQNNSEKPILLIENKFTKEDTLILEEKIRKLIAQDFSKGIEKYKKEINYSLTKVLDDFLFLKNTFKFLISFYCFSFLGSKVTEKLDFLYNEVK